MSEIVHTTTLHRDDIPKMLEVAEEVQKEADLEQQTQIVLYQQKVEELEKRLTKLREDIRNIDYVLKDAVSLRDITRTEHTDLNESCLHIVQILTDIKNRYLKQNESLHAQMEGYSEFIQKLENNEQLEFNL